MIDRRAFLRRLGFGAATAAAAAASTGLIDIEKLLWVPGEKTIFIPTPRVLDFALGDIITIDGVFGVNPTTGLTTKALQRFVITANVIGETTLLVEKIHPPIIASGLYRNSSTSPSRLGHISASRVHPLSVGRVVAQSRS